MHTLIKKYSWYMSMCSVFLISGCASPPLAVTYYSNPPGAVIYDSVTGVRHGYAPVTLSYTVAKEERQRGYKTINGTTAKWTSGASASGRDMVNLDLNRYGFNQQITFQRPDDASGLGEDMKFASDLNNQRMQQLQLQQQQLQLQQQRQACANRTTPSNDIVKNLFGPTPYEVEQQQREKAYAAANANGLMTHQARNISNEQKTGYEIGQTLGKMVGYVDPERQKAEQKQAILSRYDLTTTEGLAQAMQAAKAMGRMDIALELQQYNGCN